MSARKEEAESVGPIRVNTMFPGYEDVSVELDLPRIRGDLIAREMQLNQWATGFADARITIVDLPSIDLEEADRVKSRLIGSIEFRGEAQRNFEYFIRDSELREIQVNNLPYGTYDIMFSSALGFHRGARRQVTISHPKESFILSAAPGDPRDSGSLLIRVKRANGTDYDGPLTVALRKGRDNAAATVKFDCSPYAFQMLPAKKIQLTVIPETPRESGLPEYLKHDVEIASHKQVTLNVAMTR